MCWFRAKNVLKSVLCLAAGVCIYLLMNRDIIAFSGSVSFNFMPDLSFLKATPPGKILICFGADFLWAAALAYSVQALLGLNRRNCKYLIICTLPGVLFELFQFLGVAAGTADTADILAYLAGASAAALDISGGLKDEKIN